MKDKKIEEQVSKVINYITEKTDIKITDRLKTIIEKAIRKEIPVEKELEISLSKILKEGR